MPPGELGCICPRPSPPRLLRPQPVRRRNAKGTLSRQEPDRLEPPPEVSDILYLRASPRSERFRNSRGDIADTRALGPDGTEPLAALCPKTNTRRLEPMHCLPDPHSLSAQPQKTEGLPVCDNGRYAGWRLCAARHPQTGLSTAREERNPLATIFLCGSLRTVFDGIARSVPKHHCHPRRRGR